MEMSNPPPFTVVRNGAVGEITLSRPEAGNRLLLSEIQALGATIRSLGEDAQIKLVVLRAVGEAFCLGRLVVGETSPPTALQVRVGVTEPILSAYADIRATPVPVLAVVQGDARGFGCALVSQCDMAIAAEHARFSLPEMDTNLPPTLAISALLGKVPPKRILHMVYGRDQIDARDALAIGLLGDVVLGQELEDATQRVVAAIVDRRRSAVCAVKEYAQMAANLAPPAAASLASNMLSVVLSSQDDA